jgi:hypothetical protein
MILYELALVPLAATVRHPEIVQAWYANNGQIGLQRLGLEPGYFPEPAKSIFVCNPEDRPGANERLKAFGFKFVDGSRYVGGCPLQVARAPDCTMGPGRRAAREGGPAVPPNRLHRPCQVTPVGVAIPAARRPGLRSRKPSARPSCRPCCRRLRRNASAS